MGIKLKKDKETVDSFKEYQKKYEKWIEQKNGIEKTINKLKSSLEEQPEKPTFKYRSKDNKWEFMITLSESNRNNVDIRTNQNMAPSKKEDFYHAGSMTVPISEISAFIEILKYFTGENNGS
jgi:aminopeptidase C